MKGEFPSYLILSVLILHSHRVVSLAHIIALEWDPNIRPTKPRHISIIAHSFSKKRPLPLGLPFQGSWFHTRKGHHHYVYHFKVKRQIGSYTVMTYLVVLSSKLWFWKNWQRQRTPRRTVVGTMDNRGYLVPKYLEFWNLGTEIDSLNFVTEWQDGPS